MPTLNTASTGDAGAANDAPIPAEILAAIAAAAFTFVGKRLRITSIEQQPFRRDQVNRWSRQGRVLVQSSHNLALKHVAKVK